MLFLSSPGSIRRELSLALEREKSVEQSKAQLELDCSNVSGKWRDSRAIRTRNSYDNSPEPEMRCVGLGGLSVHISFILRHSYCKW